MIKPVKVVAVRVCIYYVIYAFMFGADAGSYIIVDTIPVIVRTTVDYRDLAVGQLRNDAIPVADIDEVNRQVVFIINKMIARAKVKIKQCLPHDRQKDYEYAQ
jgi:hypothetical protein